MAHAPTPDREPFPAVPLELKQEAPGPNGIRQGLVNHIRRLIEAGEYDTPERWAEAEARLARELR